MSIINVSSVFQTLVTCRVERTRDGFLVRDSNNHQVAVSTTFWDESALLAVLEEIVGTMKARGVQVDPKTKAAAKLPKEAPTQGLRVDPDPTPAPAPKVAPSEPVEAPKKAKKVALEGKVAVARPPVKKRKS